MADVIVIKNQISLLKSVSPNVDDPVVGRPRGQRSGKGAANTRGLMALRGGRRDT